MTTWQRVGDTKYSSPIPNSLQRRKKKTQGMGRVHRKDRRAAGAGAGPPAQRACPFSAPQLPTAAIHGWFSQCRGSLGPLGGQWSHARILGTCPLWPGSTKPPAGSCL